MLLKFLVFLEFLCFSNFCVKTTDPFHKSGSTSTHENYRPISILPSLSKFLEKAVHQ